MKASHPQLARSGSTCATCLGLVLSSGMVISARTAQAQADSADSSASTQLQEVIVTAERRQQNLQAVPLSVTALGEEAIRDLRIEQASDISRYSPGVSIGTSGQARSNSARIRGIGGAGDGWPGTDSPVGIFVDGVYYGRSSDMAMDLFDLERIEILRGPQGTLYGKNVSAGAINIITGKPSDSFESRIEATGGSFDRREVRGYVSGPLSDGLTAKLAYSVQRRDGYTENVFTGHDMDDLHRSSVRGQLRWNVASTDLLLAADFTDLNETSKPYFLYGAPIAGYTAPPAPDETSLNTDGYFRQKPWSVSLTADHSFEMGTLTSISAYRKSKYTQFGDGDGTSLTLNGAGLISHYDDHFDQFTQEIRLSSDTQGPLSWVAGLYYFRSNEDLFITHTLGSLPGSLVNIANTLSGFGPGPHTVNFNQSNQGTSYAAFTQATYELLSKLNFTAGVRWTRDQKDGDNGASGQRNVALLTWPTPYDVHVSRAWNAVTPKFTLDFTPIDNVLLYATAAKGFKSGGFVGQAVEPVAAATLFNPEYVWNYELGAKNELFDRRLRLNLAAYQMNYTDLQVTDVVGTRRLTVNAGEARIRGAELDSEVAFSHALSLYAKYALTDTVYTSFPATAVGGNLTGKRFVGVPRNEASVGSSYTFAIGSGSLQLRADATYTGQRFLNLTNTYSDGALTSVDLRATFERGPVSVALWGKNVFDKQRIAGQVTDTSSFFQPYKSSAATGYTTYTPPREYGATVGYQF